MHYPKQDKHEFNQDTFLIMIESIESMKTISGLQISQNFKSVMSLVERSMEGGNFDIWVHWSYRKNLDGLGFSRGRSLIFFSFNTLDE